VKYAHVLSRLLNTPLAISQSKLDIITSNVTLKLLAGEGVSTETNPDLLPPNRPTGKTGVINVFDTLAAKNGAGMSGGTTYTGISSQITQAVANGYTKLYFYIDSPGGEVAGLFGLASFISSLPAKYGIETIAITDGMMASAAYVLGAACQKVYATESSIVGSIGVIMTLVNTTKADEAEGLEYTIIRSKSDKALLNPHEKFPDKALDDAKSMLATLDNIMNNTVLAARPSLSLETLTSLAGGTVLAEEALALGLIDAVVSSFDEALTLGSTTTQHSTATKGNNMAMTLEDALVQLNAAQTELAALKASSGLDKIKAQADEQARIVGILDASTTFGIPTSTAVKFIKSNASVDTALTSFETIKEALQASNPVDISGAGAVPTVQNIPTPAPSNQPLSFEQELLAGLKAAGEQPQLFKGVG